MLIKHKKFLLILGLIFLLIFLTYFSNAFLYIKNSFIPKDSLVINISKVNPIVEKITADPSNKLLLKVTVRNNVGNPVSHIKLKNSLNMEFGEIYPQSARTNKYGEVLLTYIPPDNINNEDSLDIVITSTVDKSENSSSIKVEVVKVPIIFVHGYQGYPELFRNMQDYFFERNYIVKSLSYDSSKGVLYGANRLREFLHDETINHLKNGLQVNKFSLITHSLGGLISRYYTSSSEYIKNDNVDKLIFLSVPHKGSYIANLGKTIFNDTTIEELMPESELFVNTFPQMINKGLNSNIRVGNVLAEFDEVVTSESASLSKWNIKTDIFNIGTSAMTFDNLLSGKVLEAPNHNNILNNKRVFERIEEMISGNLNYPSVLSN